ncbi:PQQ-binding-like beta-propeller repeat protein, partial [Dokdonella sp.]|uniref:outer membrane protein assembly factor BamB family protein n=1 Tax=Dokdonella sp. TaxID=2291710 RepID=UPI002F4300F8
MASEATAIELWRSDTYASAPPTFAYLWPPRLPQSAVAFADDGDVVYGSPSPNLSDQRIVRVRGDGSIRWAFALPLSESPDTFAAILADGDGGATFSHTVTGRVVHIGADGSLAWSRAVPASSLERVAANRIASAGGGRVTMFDATSGEVVWQRALSPPSIDESDSIVADGAGNLYAEVRGAAGWPSVDVVKLAPNGEAIWRVAVDEADGSVVAAGGGLVYVKGDYDLHALDTGDGASTWSRYVGSAVALRFSPDADSEPVIADHGHIERLDASNGSTRWSTPIADLQRLDRVGDAVLAATSSTLLRIDPTDGAILWAAPASGGPERPMGIGPYGSEARFIARAIAAPGLAGPIDRRIDLASGATIADVDTASITQGISETSRLDADGYIVCAGVSQHPEGPQLNLRSFDGTTGAVRWQASEGIDVPGDAFAPSALQAAPELAVGGDMFAISQSLDDGIRCDGNTGVARVASYSLDTGGRRWQAWLRDASDRSCPLVSAPLPDAAGNVFVSLSTLVYCPESPGCQRRTLYKLAAGDGSVLWRRDESADAGTEGLVLYPKTLTGVDMDVVLAGSVGDVPATAQRIAGTDGAVVWTSHEFDSLAPTEIVDRIDDGRLIVYGDEAYGGNATSYHFAALDPTSGTTSWTSSAPWQPCYSSGCAGYGEAYLLPGGDKLVPFQRDYAPWLRRQHNDGSGLVDEWMLGAASPIL